MFLFKPKFVIPLALFSGLLASYGVYGYMKQQEMKMKQTVVTTPVVVAAIGLSFGDSLYDDNMALKNWPEGLVPEGSFRTKAELAGRVLKTDVVAGEPLLVSKLASTGSDGGVQSQIPPGMRAMTVAVNVVSGVGGFVLPKTKVDVLVTINSRREQEQAVTKVLLQDILVLAVDQTSKKKDDDPVTVKSVTLLVTPEQAEKLALGAAEGKLQLTLRNIADTAPTKTSGARISQITSGGEPEKKPPAPRVVRPAPAPKTAAPEPLVKPAVVEEKPSPPKHKVIEIIRSNVRSDVTFDEQGREVKTKK